LHFDNGSYISQSRADRVTNQLIKHVDDLTRFESLIISESTEDDGLNSLIHRLAPQLRRFARYIYTILIREEESLLHALRPRNLQQLEIQALDSIRVENFFMSNSFPKLTHLAVSEDEPQDDMDIASDIDSDREIRPVRWLLEHIASSTGSLVIFEVLVTNLQDDKGLVTDAIAAVARANKQSLKILDFCAGKDASRRSQFEYASTTYKWLQKIFRGALSDSTKWVTLPALILSEFGVDISCFRVLGATLWQFIFTGLKSGNGELPPLEHVRALFEAIYPRAKTCAASRIKPFEIFLVNEVHDALFSYNEARPVVGAELASWMISEIDSNLRELDLRSVSAEPILIGLFGVISFCDACGIPVDAVWQHVIALASLTHPDQPLMACFQLLESTFGFNGNVIASKLHIMIVKYRGREKMDFFAPFGQNGDALIIFLRDNLFEAARDIMLDSELLDPLQMHPTREIPMLLFILLEPGHSDCFRNESTFSVDINVKELFDRHVGALKGIRYAPDQRLLTGFLSRQYDSSVIPAGPFSEWLESMKLL
jgi:hypothetical protein